MPLWIIQKVLKGNNSLIFLLQKLSGGCHGCDRMVVGFTTTCTISAIVVIEYLYIYIVLNGF
jgi:hypothetical protein